MLAKTIKDSSLISCEDTIIRKKFHSILSKIEKTNVVSINFKKELKFLNTKERASHNMHKFPAKLIPHIPYFFIRSLTSPGETVLDVFCGSGTVLVESMLAGRNCVGTDINPLCRLITKVKTTPLKEKELQLATNKLFTKLTENIRLKPPKFLNIDYWFSKHAQHSLTKIKWAIDTCDFSDEIRDFFYVCFSSIVRKSSNADPRIGPPVFSKHLKEKINKGRRVYPISYFKQEVIKNTKRIQEFSSLCFQNCRSQILSDDARKLSLKDETVDLVITSPPYMSAQKYFRSTRLELLWLGLVTEQELRNLDSQIIGTERIRSIEYSKLQRTGIDEVDTLAERLYQIDKLRTAVMVKYFKDLQFVFKEIFRCLKCGKFFVLVIGNNEIRGIRIPAHLIAAKLAENIGFEKELMMVDEIKSRGLMTKRNKTAGLINSEWILVFRKE
jgi:DNA modification methylase